MRHARLSRADSRSKERQLKTRDDVCLRSTSPVRSVFPERACPLIAIALGLVSRLFDLLDAAPGVLFGIETGGVWVFFVLPKPGQQMTNCWGQHTF